MTATPTTAAAAVAATEAAAASASATEAVDAASAKTLNALLNMPAQMELSQIELIYRAEGNANLVLALPQFKKVLRLPKTISSRPTKQPERSSDSCQPEAEASVSDPARASSSKAGVLTMPDFMAYIEIMRRLLGNEFVCAADIVAIPKESDRFWINEHIRAHRPVARLDKEFVGPFGLLLPDVTQLPATFDVLLANLQAKDMNMDTDMNADSSSSSSSSRRCPGITRLGDTYAIEIKPKQGWLQLPSDVSDLFDLMPLDTTCDDPRKVRPLRVHQFTMDPDRCWCRYCSMQLLKLQTGKIRRLGDYCPMQLFSGVPRRMLDALNALFACPQNNLRVFQSGNLIYGDHANSISCDELHTRVFPGEIMALIKHLLVACLLREYNNELAKEDVQTQSQSRSHSHSHSHVASAAAFGQSTAKRCGTETKATETIKIGMANVDAAAAAVWHVDQKQQKGSVQTKAKAEAESGIVEFVKTVAGQPQRRATRAAVEKTSQRYTKRCKITATTAATETEKETDTETETTTIASTWLSTNVAMAATRTQMETETLATKTATATATATAMATPAPNPNETQALISKAEIFHLPKNCVLQKILHLQLLVKRHFHYMWQAGFAALATPTYEALRTLLGCQAAQQELSVDELAAEQAYLLGATALDCSIMLTFQEIRCQSKHNSALQPWLVVVRGRQFLTKLSVLDLDPKPDSHYHKFIEHTRQIEKRCRALN